MKVQLNKTNKGFTLIEMIGVLAVIAILAAVLIPKVFDAINNSRVNNASISCQTAKTAVADHYAKFGTLPVNGSNPAAPAPITAFPANDYDKVLLAEGFLDKPFAVKIGDGNDANNNVRLAQVDTTAPSAALGSFTYDLDGDGNVDTAATSHVVEAVIAGTSLEDARALDRLIDGSSVNMSYTGTETSNLEGRVKWAANGSVYDINVYLTHR